VRPGDALPLEEQDWHRFRQIRKLGNHWARPGWADGRRSYHWLLTFKHASGLHALAGQCQVRFRDLPQFDVVPLATLHLTIQRVAFTDEIPANSLDRVVVAVRQRCRNLAPFWLQIGWLAGSTGAIRFTALPVEPVLAVRSAVVGQDLADPTEDELGWSAGDFWPHVSIAYSNTAQAALPVARSIEMLRSLPPADVVIDHVALVELRRGGRTYRWKLLEQVALKSR